MGRPGQSGGFSRSLEEPLAPSHFFVADPSQPIRPDGPVEFAQSELDPVEPYFVKAHPARRVLSLTHGLQQAGGPDDGVVVECEPSFRLMPGIDRRQVCHGTPYGRQVHGDVTYPPKRTEVGIEQAIQGQRARGKDREGNDGFQQGEACGHRRDCGLWIVDCAARSVPKRGLSAAACGVTGVAV